MGSTGDPGGEPSLAPRGPVASSPKRGARRKGAPATHDICPARSDLHHAQHQSRFRPAVLLTGKRRRRRGGGGAGLRCHVAPPADEGRRLAAPAATAGGGHGWPGMPSLWDGSRRPLVGGGAACCKHHSAQGTAPEGLALTLALRKLPTSQQKAFVGLNG
jgi:hypothetical protein